MTASLFSFQGIITALVTPFIQGKLDEDSFIRLIQYQMDKGIKSFVLNGTTGESPTLEKEEVRKIFEIAKSYLSSKDQLILGVGSNSTKKTLQMSELAQSLGADAVLVVVPYYNKPSQNGLIFHFTQVAQNTSLPVILYNVPSRTVVSLEEETIFKLSQLGNVMGIKEASGDMKLVKKLKNRCDPYFCLLSGDDDTCVDFMLKGGCGVISVVSHLIPSELTQIFEKITQEKNKRSASENSKNLSVTSQYAKYKNLVRLLFIESNPAPVKMALYKMGLIRSPEVRLPLVPLSEKFEKELEIELENLSLI